MIKCDAWWWMNPGALALAMHGDLLLARRYMSKLAQVCTTHYENIITNRSDAVTIPIRFCGSTLCRRAGLNKENLALIEASRSSFAGVDKLMDWLEQEEGGIYANMGWIQGDWANMRPAYNKLWAKRHHWLSKRADIDEASFRAWLPPPEAGSCGWYTEDGQLVFSNDIMNMGCRDGGLAAEVFESLGEIENGLIAAETDLRRFGTIPHVAIEAGAARARCLAKLDRADEAEEAFNEAISEAVTFLYPLWELVVRRDLIAHVLDAADRRSEQIVPLGKCIAAMALPAAEYTPVLDLDGLDAEDLVAAYKEEAGGT